MKIKFAFQFLFLFLISQVAHGNICDRSDQIISAVLNKLKTKTGFNYRCYSVSEKQLAEITQITVYHESEIYSPKSNDFEGFVNLSSLVLYRADLSKFNSTVLSPLVNLKFLTMSGFLYSGVVDETIFSKLPTLEELSLSIYAPAVLPEKLFSDLTQLKKLLIASESTTLPSKLFNNLDLLRYLSIQTPYLKTLNPELLKNLKLNELSAYFGSLTELPYEKFLYGDSIRSLILNVSAVNTLPKELMRMNNLGTSNRSLSLLALTVGSAQIPEDFFSSSKIDHLDVTGKFENLPTKLKFRDASVDKLSLSGKFSEIPDHFLSETTVVTQLILTSSRLKTISQINLDEMKSIEQKYIYDCHLFEAIDKERLNKEYGFSFYSDYVDYGKCSD